MLIEKELEINIATAIRGLEIDGAYVLTSRETAVTGEVKDEFDVGAKTIIAVASGIREHTDFENPTADIPFSVAVSTRSEMDATGDAHEIAMNAVIGLLEDWHADGQAFSQAVSTDRYFAAALKIDGGGTKTFDETRSVWIETISFTIRGTIKDNAATST